MISLEIDYKLKYEETLKELYTARSTINMYEALSEGNIPEACFWLYRKVNNQRQVLNALQKKGKGHTKLERDTLV